MAIFLVANEELGAHKMPEAVSRTQNRKYKKT